jgi:hypothetical protein
MREEISGSASSKDCDECAPLLLVCKPLVSDDCRIIGGMEVLSRGTASVTLETALKEDDAEEDTAVREATFREVRFRTEL